jgi:hypothetical protein
MKMSALRRRGGPPPVVFAIGLVVFFNDTRCS